MLFWPALGADEHKHDVDEVDDEAEDEDVIEDEVGHEHAPVHHVVRKLADALVLLHRAGRTGSVDLAAHRQWERVAEVELVTRELQKESWSLVPG